MDGAEGLVRRLRGHRFSQTTHTDFCFQQRGSGFLATIPFRDPLQSSSPMNPLANSAIPPTAMFANRCGAESTAADVTSRCFPFLLCLSF